MAGFKSHLGVESFSCLTLPTVAGINVSQTSLPVSVHNKESTRVGGFGRVLTTPVDQYRSLKANESSEHHIKDYPRNRALSCLHCVLVDNLLGLRQS